MRQVVLSAHLDDAVFSAFDVLDGDDDTVVITMCTGIPDSGQPPSRYDDLTRSADPAIRYRQRVSEDLTVAESGGWHVGHLGVLDAPYRHVTPDMDHLVSLVMDYLTDGCASIWIPAGIGGHVDHVLTREVGLRAAAQFAGAAYLYADLPYAATFGWPHWVTGRTAPAYLDVDAFWMRWLGSSLRGPDAAVVRQLSHEQQRQKVRLMMMYGTQFEVSESGPSRHLTHPDRLPFEVTWPVRAADLRT